MPKCLRVVRRCQKRRLDSGAQGEEDAPREKMSRQPPPPLSPRPVARNPGEAWQPWGDSTRPPPVPTAQDSGQWGSAPVPLALQGERAPVASRGHTDQQGPASALVQRPPDDLHPVDARRQHAGDGASDSASSTCDDDRQGVGQPGCRWLSVSIPSVTASAFSPFLSTAGDQRHPPDAGTGTGVDTRPCPARGWRHCLQVGTSEAGAAGSSDDTARTDNACREHNDSCSAYADQFHTDRACKNFVIQGVNNERHCKRDREHKNHGRGDRDIAYMDRVNRHIVYKNSCERGTAYKNHVDRDIAYKDLVNRNIAYKNNGDIYTAYENHGDRDSGTMTTAARSARDGVGLGEPSWETSPRSASQAGTQSASHGQHRARGGIESKGAGHSAHPPRHYPSVCTTHTHHTGQRLGLPLTSLPTSVIQCTGLGPSHPLPGGRDALRRQEHDSLFDTGNYIALTEHYIKLPRKLFCSGDDHHVHPPSRMESVVRQLCAADSTSQSPLQVEGHPHSTAFNGATEVHTESEAKTSTVPRSDVNPGLVNTTHPQPRTPVAGVGPSPLTLCDAGTAQRPPYLHVLSLHPALSQRGEVARHRGTDRALALPFHPPLPPYPLLSPPPTPAHFPQQPLYGTGIPVNVSPPPARLGCPPLSPGARLRSLQSGYGPASFDGDDDAKSTSSVSSSLSAGSLSSPRRLEMMTSHLDLNHGYSTSTPSPMTSPSSQGQLSPSSPGMTSVELVNGGYGYKNPILRQPSSNPPEESATTGVPVPEGGYRCQVCDKQFKIQRHLTRHLKCHSEVKRFLCSFCGKGFNDTFDLKRHTRTHTGVKPFRCQCGKAFTQRCSLESHERKVHGERLSFGYKERRAKLYVCEDCGSTSADPTVHFLHIQARHPHSPVLHKFYDKRQFKFSDSTLTSHLYSQPAKGQAQGGR